MSATGVECWDPQAEAMPTPASGMAPRFPGAVTVYPMKILMLNYEFPPLGGGGGQAHLALLQQYAGRQDLKVDVLTSAAQPGLSIEEFARNISIHKVGIHKKDLHLWRRSEIIEWLIKGGAFYRRLLRRKQIRLDPCLLRLPDGLAVLPDGVAAALHHLAARVRRAGGECAAQAGLQDPGTAGFQADLEESLRPGRVQ